MINMFKARYIVLMGIICLCFVPHLSAETIADFSSSCGDNEASFGCATGPNGCNVVVESYLVNIPRDATNGNRPVTPFNYTIPNDPTNGQFQVIVRYRTRTGAGAEANSVTFNGTVGTPFNLIYGSDTTYATNFETVFTSGNISALTLDIDSDPVDADNLPGLEILIFKCDGTSSSTFAYTSPNRFIWINAPGEQSNPYCVTRTLCLPESACETGGRDLAITNGIFNIHQDYANCTREFVMEYTTDDGASFNFTEAPPENNTTFTHTISVSAATTAIDISLCTWNNRTDPDPDWTTTCDRGVSTGWANVVVEDLCACETTCTSPTVAAFGVAASCTNGEIDANSAYLQISMATDATHYNYITGSDYSTGDTNIANATAFDPTTALPLQFGLLPNPTGSQDYTIRIFNEASDCFTDITVTVEEQTCVKGCACKDYLYLNDTGLGYVEKFEVDAVTGALIEIGDSQNGQPWLNANNIVDQPHGIAADVNGFLYIGERDTNNDEYNIQKFTCDGTKVDADLTTPVIDNFTDDGYSYSHFSIGNYLYTNIFDGASTGFNEIRIYDLCNGDLIGCQADASVWGFAAGIDGYWYGAGAGNDANDVWTNGIIRGPLDPTTYTDGAGGCGSETEVWKTYADLGLPEPNSATDFRLMGIDQDESGNVYVAFSQNFGFNPPSFIMKITADGTTTSSLVDSELETDVSDNLNWAGARGLVWSPSANLIYVSSIDDCIAAFTTDLVYVPEASVHTPGNFPKQIGLLTECCPTPNNLTIDTTLCIGPLNDPIFLQDIIDCNGTICEGIWEEGDGNTGLTYNQCDNTVTIDAAEACGSFSLGSNGTGNNPQCGVFHITVNIEVRLIADNTITGNDTICTGSTPTQLTSNASVTSGTLSYQWESSTTSCDAGFSPIGGANNATYTPPALTQTTYYRLVTSVDGDCSSGSCSSTSNCVSIVVDPNCSDCPPVNCLPVTITKTNP